MCSNFCHVLKKTAKATDIAKFGFDTKEVKIKEGGRYINGVELYETITVR